MYKIYVRKPNTSRTIFEPYYEEIEGEKVEYETDDIEELADKFKELLSDYTLDQLRAVQDLTTEITVVILDS